MKNNPQVFSIKRIILFAIILSILAIIINFLTFKIKRDERKAQLTIEAIQSHEFLSGEIYHVIYGLEGDFSFFEKSLLRYEQKTNIDSMLDFLDTHPHYFKVRLIDLDGREIFKLLPDSKTQSYFEDRAHFNLAEQKFFKELKSVADGVFFISSMDANVINGKVEEPIRPTIRVAKKVKGTNGTINLLVTNIDGERFLELFDKISNDPYINKVLIDSNGYYIASSPELSVENYTLNKKRIDPVIINKLKYDKGSENVIDHEGQTYIYTKLSLPRTNDNWFLITIVPNSLFEGLFKSHFLKWLFWEAIAIALLTLWFWRDEKKRHREEVVQVLLRERSEFIQNVSHQLKTPLTIIHNDLLTNDQIENRKNDLIKEVRHLIKVVENLLLLTQIDALKTLPLKRENTFEILSDAIDLVALKAKEKNVSIRVHLDEKLEDSLYLLERLSLPELLKSAFVNILDNAIDFTPQGSSVDIEIKYQDDATVISIQDHGPGVDPQFAPHIFDRFARDMAHDKRKGSGLGLAIAKKIIDLHLGKIELISNHPGACFQITL